MRLRGTCSGTTSSRNRPFGPGLSGRQSAGWTPPIGWRPISICGRGFSSGLRWWACGPCWGGFRFHGDQRSLNHQTAYLDEVEHSFRIAGGRHSRGLDAWIRRSRLPELWPLKVLPSLGFVQPVTNIAWSKPEQRWVKTTEYIS